MSALAFLCFLAFLFGPKLNGQTYTPFHVELESIKEKANWTLGPLLIDPSLQFDLSYDDNIYGTYGGRGPISDYVASLAAPFNIYVPFRNWLILSFTDNPQYLHFFELKNESSFNNSYSLGARLLLLNRLVLSGSYGFNRAKYRVSSEIESRVFQQVESSSGSLFFETARETAIGVLGSTSRYKHEDETLSGEVTFLSTSLNRKEDNFRLEFYRQAFVDSSFFLNFGFTDYAFDYSQSRYRDSYSYQAYAGIRFPLLGRARGLLSLGYKNFRPREPERKGYSGPVGNTGLDFRFARFGLRFQLVRDVPFSYYEDSIFFIDSRLGAGLSFYPTQNIRLDYDFSLGRGEYPEGTLIPMPDGTYQKIQRKDTYLIHSASIVFRVFRNTGIGFRISNWERESNSLTYNSDRRTAGVFLSYDF
jgi:hypothetical protein